MLSDKNVRIEVSNCLQYNSLNCVFINGFTKAAFVDLVKTLRDNDLLTIFVIGLIRTSNKWEEGQQHTVGVL